MSVKHCRENQNTHFVYNNFFSKIVLFIRWYGILYSRTVHKWQHGASALHAEYLRLLQKHTQNL